MSNSSLFLGFFFIADAEFRNTGLERAECLAKDLEWFKEQGYSIPEPSSPGLNYASYIEELSKKDPQAFICHFYNTYFAHSAGGRMIGKKVSKFSSLLKSLPCVCLLNESHYFFVAYSSCPNGYSGMPCLFLL